MRRTASRQQKKALKTLAFIKRIDSVACQNTCVVDQDVEGAELRVDFAKEVRDFSRITGIGLDCDGFAASGLNLPHDIERCIPTVLVIDRDRIAASTCKQRDLCTDAATGTGDQHDLLHKIPWLPRPMLGRGARCVKRLRATASGLP